MLIVIEIGMDRKCRLRPKDQVDTLATMSTAAHVSNKISFRPRAPLYQVYSNIYIEILVIQVALMEYKLVGRMISRITYFTSLLFTSAIEILITVILLIIVFYAIAIRKEIKLYQKLDIQLFLGFQL